MKIKLKILINFFVILGILLPNLAYLQDNVFSPPETIGELGARGEKVLKEILETFPKNIKNFFFEDVLPVWLKMYQWFKKTFWDPYLGPFFQKEIEKRKPIIEEEFKQEKSEIKQSAQEEIPQVTKSLLERFKELFK